MVSDNEANIETVCILTKPHRNQVLLNFLYLHLSCFYRVFKTYALMFHSKSCHGDLFSIFLKLLLTSGFITPSFLFFTLTLVSLLFFYLS